jgi:methylenetetrahydrofolate--tRNA-(uracil-5-)-methyltransferase
MRTVIVVGGGLAGSEASWQLAERGYDVTLMEMRPQVSTGAHRGADLAEIICSNSLKSTRLDTASGLLKAELEILGSKLLQAASETRVAAGHALAVDREAFSSSVTGAIERHPRITVSRVLQKTLELPQPAIVATGPLTESSLFDSLSRHISSESLYFYDAIAPSIDSESIDMSRCFWASRYGKGDPDYCNVPLEKSDYLALLENIRSAALLPISELEEERYFESCLPIEVMASRGDDTLRFGPLRPIGLMDARTGREPYALIQLRQEKLDGSLLGMVGFQTRMTYGSQLAVVRSLPGLENADILRYGAIHRNSFINTPRACLPYQMDRKQPGLFYAGQLCGVEGYVECIASGLVAALSTASWAENRKLPRLPRETLLGGLMDYIHTETRHFQPMNANMGIVPGLGRKIRNRSERNTLLAERSIEAMKRFAAENEWFFGPAIR